MKVTGDWLQWASCNLAFPQEKPWPPPFLSHPGKAVGTNRRTVEMALKNNQSVHCLRAAWAVWSKQCRCCALFTLPQRAGCKVSLHDSIRDGEVPQAALRRVRGLLAMLLQIWLEGAKAWADRQTSTDLQILPGSSII